MAAATGKPLIRLQCYEGLDESKALYEWDYRRQLLELQLRQGEHGSLADARHLRREFLLARPLLAAIGRRLPWCCSSTRSTGWT